MRARVEHADALTILRELPGGLAQVCLAAPQSIEVPHTLVVLAEARRVLRHDGTLWVWHRGSETLLTGLRELGWVHRPLPAGESAFTHREDPERLFLFTKTTGRYYYRSHPFARAHRPQSVGVGASARARRAERCSSEVSWRSREARYGDVSWRAPQGSRAAPAAPLTGPACRGC